jgi:hypothetical protein
VGGEFSYWACVPSQAMLRPVVALADVRRVEGASDAVIGPIRPAGVFARRNRYVRNWDASGEAASVTSIGADLVRDHSRLDGPRRVVVATPDDRLLRVSAQEAVAICTGSRAALPGMPGIAEAGRGQTGRPPTRQAFPRDSPSSAAARSPRSPTSDSDVTALAVSGPHARRSARELRDLVLDPGSWTSWDAPVPERPVDRGYAAELAEAARRTRQDEAVVTGEGTLRGRRVAVVAGEFGFLAGSIGVATAQRLIAAVERATEEGLPLLAAPLSGGTRMQEGTAAFLQMIGITAAIIQHKQAGLPYLVHLRNVYLRNPTFAWSG